MASPHLAGSGAVIRGQYPNWSAAEVRSAVVNTAQRGELRDFNLAAPIAQNLLAAVNTTIALDPFSLSFRGVPSGSGQTRHPATRAVADQHRVCGQDA
jgi:hypothetical protein